MYIPPLSSCCLPVIPTIHAVLGHSNPRRSSFTFKAVNGAETAICTDMKYGSTVHVLDICTPPNSTGAGIVYHY